MRWRKQKARQQELVFARRGGKRKGAGRKQRLPGKRRVRHRPHQDFKASQPVHVTLRIVDGVGSLRRRLQFHAIRKAMHVVLSRPDFRIVHASIQGNHLHLICEANDRVALSRGMAAFKISAARKLNKAYKRSGAIFADRYHAEVLETPTQVRNAINYCLNNWRRHSADRGCALRVDPFSTGIYFDGWREAMTRTPVVPPDEVLPASKARTWLLAEGWRKAGGSISCDARPGPRR
jgi:REP element-mobilizing transposase RayT